MLQSIALYVLTHDFSEKDVKIFREIIPKGFYYFKGTQNGKKRLSGYASKQLKIVEEIVI